MPRPSLPAFAAILATPSLLMAALAGHQATLSGRITDLATGLGIAGLEAMINQHDRRTEPDSLSSYRFAGLPIWALGNMRGVGTQGTLACFSPVIVEGLVYSTGGATQFCDVPDLSREFSIQELAAVEYDRTTDPNSPAGE